MLKVFIVFLWASILATGSTLNAIVIRVLDGDTIQVKIKEKKFEHVRLFGIDAPELSQVDGIASRQYLSDRIKHKTVNIVLHGTDHYGRLLGEIYDKNGENINKEMIQFGLAWVYRRTNQKTSWLTLERNAKKNRIGLWRRQSQLPPWEYRKKNSRKN